MKKYIVAFTIISSLFFIAVGAIHFLNSTLTEENHDKN